MGTEFILSSASTRTYYDLGKGPWDRIDWGLEGAGLLASIKREIGELGWSPDIAEKIFADVAALPPDRTFYSEHARAYEDAVESENPFRCVGSRYGSGSVVTNTESSVVTE